ncbi:hypothetical protein [Parapedobacter defluvii]|uniref:hypothetical protein n=1 Tax=Parapedobacter defluvii TaxID=2045106 RepID=UPI001663B70A|nr:hypothetical protein [Parapedobacter defluvii]
MHCADDMADTDRHEYKKYRRDLQIRRVFLRVDDKVAGCTVLFELFYSFLNVIHIDLFGCSGFLLEVDPVVTEGIKKAIGMDGLSICRYIKVIPS